MRDALDQAAAVRAGEVSARELTEAALAAIERLDPDINAFVTLAAERALAEADAIGPGDERPFAGVPIAIKDIGPVTEGIRTAFGSVLSGDWVPPVDSAMVAKLRAAGAVIVGKTSTPELGITPVTEPARFGPTRNPWDLERTTGGSSGGSAAAVAAGMVALAHGNDGGGSIRIPAACCGVVGLKPSRGRVSTTPLVDLPSGLVVDGVLTRSVRDTAAALDVMAGYEPGDFVTPAPPSTTFLEAAQREPRRLRIALTLDPPVDAEVDPEHAEATRATAALLADLGHEVDEAAPDWNARDLVDDFLTVWAVDVATGAGRIALLRGSPLDPADTEPLTRELIEHAGKASAVDLNYALASLRLYARRAVAFWSGHDVLLTPSLAQPPLPHGSLDARRGETAIDAFFRALDFVPFSPLVNITGQPAVSLPLHASGSGLPIGVQLIGPPGGEELLLGLSAQLEQAHPWAERRPALALA